MEAYRQAFHWFHNIISVHKIMEATDGESKLGDFPGEL